MEENAIIQWSGLRLRWFKGKQLCPKPCWCVFSQPAFCDVFCWFSNNLILYYRTSVLYFFTISLGWFKLRGNWCSSGFQHSGNWLYTYIYIYYNDCQQQMCVEMGMCIHTYAYGSLPETASLKSFPKSNAIANASRKQQDKKLQSTDSHYHWEGVQNLCSAIVQRSRRDIHQQQRRWFTGRLIPATCESCVSSHGSRLLLFQYHLFAPLVRGCLAFASICHWLMSFPACQSSSSPPVCLSSVA